MSITRIHDENVAFDPKALAAEQRNPTRPLVHRRTILRATAASIALPVLHSLLSPSEARAQAKPLIRFVGWHKACGVWAPSWFPADTGAAYTLSPTLTPLAPVKDKVLVLSGLQNTAACNPTGSHGCGPAAMLTCRQGTKPQITVGISADQVYAQSLMGATRLPSMQLAVSSRTFSDVAYPAVYNGTVSWASPTQPLPPVTRPDAIFDSIFAGNAAAAASMGNAAAAAELAKRKALRTSVLDKAMAEATGLKPKLGVSDRRKLDEYLTSVRQVETEIQRITPASPTCSPGTMTKPAANISDVPTITKIMLDLMVLAFQCDTTRVITFMQQPGGQMSYPQMPWLNITEDHHTLSHHLSDPAKGAKLTAIETWEVAQFSYFLQKMNAVSEGTGTMLDNSIIFFSSEISDGNRHNQTNRPILVAGSGGGQIKTGRHLILQDQLQPELFITLLNMLGVPVTSFGAVGMKPLAGLA